MKLNIKIDRPLTAESVETFQRLTKKQKRKWAHILLSNCNEVTKQERANQLKLGVNTHERND